MAKRDKRIAAMRRNPKDVRPDDLDTVLRAAGFATRQQGTSHKVYSYGSYLLPVPQHPSPLKAIYVKQALALLDQIAEEHGGGGDEESNDDDGSDSMDARE